MNNQELMVSVTLLTYFHEKYIRDCLEGIIRQETSFPFEVIVGDDCSEDGTRNILREYAEKHPDIFKLVLRPENIGATNNLYDLLTRAKGKYIAGLEGDDYWTDSHKLQKQVDFLEQHPEYIGCSHDVEVVDENGKKAYQSHKYIEGRHWTFYKPVYTYRDYQKFELPGQGSSYVYRNVFREPKYDYSIIKTASPMVGDMTLMLILSAQGDWYFMQDESMSAYRFVTTKGGKNWASWVTTKNRTCTDFIYRVRLENYAHQVLHKPLNLFKQKFELFQGAYWAKEWNPLENRSLFEEICRYAKPAWHYWGRLYWKNFLDKHILPTVLYAKRHGELYTDDTFLASQTWNDFDRVVQSGKTIVAFGDGMSFYEFMKKYKHNYDIAAILDNSAAKWGTTKFFYDNPTAYWRGEYEFVSVREPEFVRKWESDKFVILITSTLYYKEIAAQLDGMGFHDYYVFGIMESKIWYYRLYEMLCKKSKEAET